MIKIILKAIKACPDLLLERAPKYIVEKVPISVIVPSIYTASVLLFTISLHNYLEKESSKWIHTFERESYLAKSLHSNGKLDEYINNSTIRKISRRVDNDGHSIYSLDEIESCFHNYKNIHPLNFSHASSISFNIDDSRKDDGYRSFDLNIDSVTFLGNPNEPVHKPSTSDAKKTEPASNSSTGTEAISVSTTDTNPKPGKDVDGSDESDTTQSQQMDCSKLYLEFRHAEIYKNKIETLSQYLEDNAKDVKFHEIGKRNLINTIEIFLFLPNLEANEGEQARLLEQYRRVLSRQSELYHRLIFNYKWNSSISSVINISGLIALFCFLLRNSTVFTDKKDDEQPAAGENKERESNRKKWLTVWLITSSFFFLLFYQSSKIFMLEANLQTGLERYQEYAALENSIRSFIVTGSITESGNKFEKAEANRFIQLVDNQLRLLNRYSLLTDSSIVDSRFGNLFNILDASTLQNSSSVSLTNSLPDKSLETMIEDLQEEIRELKKKEGKGSEISDGSGNT